MSYKMNQLISQNNLANQALGRERERATKMEHEMAAKDKEILSLRQFLRVAEGRNTEIDRMEE